MRYFIIAILLFNTSPVFAQECPEIITCSTYTWHTRGDKYEYRCKWEDTFFENEEEIKVSHKNISFYSFESVLKLDGYYFEILSKCPKYYFTLERHTETFFTYIAIREDIKEVEKVAECLQDKKECYRVYLQDKIKNDWR